MNYRSYRNGNSANFFCMFVMAKISKELFTPTLNGIVISVQYEPSMSF